MKLFREISEESVCLLPAPPDKAVLKSLDEGKEQSNSAQSLRLSMDPLKGGEMSKKIFKLSHFNAECIKVQ